MFRTCSNSYIHIPVREYLTVETNVPHKPMHAVGMQPSPLDAFHTECRGQMSLFFLPSDTFLTECITSF